MSEPHARQVIPAGNHTTLDYLFPILDLLIERGHPPVSEKADHGFEPRPHGWECALIGRLTPEDWAATNERFVLPNRITYHPEAEGGYGLIRDGANYVDIFGAWIADDDDLPT